MGVLDDATKYAQRLRSQDGIPFLKATYLAAQKFDKRGGETFQSILSKLRSKGSKRSASMRTSKPARPAPAPRPAPIAPKPTQQEFPFEQRLIYALGIQEGSS